MIVFKKDGLEYSGGGDGIGLKNINQRKEQIYGLQYKLVVDSKQHSGTTVKLMVPMVNLDTIN